MPIQAMVGVWLNVSRRPAELVHVVDGTPAGRGERRDLACAVCKQQLTVLFLASRNFDIAGQWPLDPQFRVSFCQDGPDW
jgi:hypothetical protein